MRRHLAECSIVFIIFPFYDYVYIAYRLAHRAVVMISAGIDLRDIHADSRDQEEVVEHGTCFLFGKGLLLKVVASPL